jgi:hypothetical protein
MKITDWRLEIEKIDWLVTGYTIILEESEAFKNTQNIVFNLIDRSILEFYESNNFAKNKYKYCLQWMTKDKSLIRRWDNNSYHTYISTYPFHQHIGSEENVQPSEEMTLEKVLKFIAENL